MTEFIIGLDEAGCGPLCGPLVAGAVILPFEDCENYKHLDTLKLCDSKKLTEKKRNTMYTQIVKTCRYGIGMVDNDEIDRIGLGRARRIVFHRALDDMFSKMNEFSDCTFRCIIDGTLAEQYKNIPHECIPKADDTFPCVSAASILAKCVRDDWVYKLCESEPELTSRYDWVHNKGYPTPKHLKGIREYGITSYHRKSFGPCR